MSIKPHLNCMLPLLIIPLILVIIWFRNGFILGGGDEQLLFYNSKKILQITSQVWLEYNTGYPVIFWLARLSFVYIIYFFTVILHIPPFLIQASSFYILMCTGVLSVFYLIRKNLEKDKNVDLIATISSFFYLFNPFSMSQVWGRGQYAQYFSFALLPLALLIFSIGLEKKKLIYSVFLSLACLIFSTAFNFLTFAITLWVILILYFIYWILISNNKKKDALFGGILFVLSFILWAIVNFWWLLPTIASGSKILTGYNDTENNLGSLLGVSRNFTPDIIVRLLHRTYFYDTSSLSPIFTSWYFQLISFIPLIFVLIGIYIVIKKRALTKLRFSLVLLLLGLIISLGANPPLGWLFIWIFKQVSILQAFRNPFEKFGIVYALGYSAVFAIGLVGFFENSRFKSFGIYVILFLTCVIFAWPMWTGRVVAGVDKRIGVDVPKYYQDINAWLNSQNENYRVLMTPIWSGDGARYQWNNTVYNGIDPMMFLLDIPAISTSAQIPYFYDLALNIRNYIGRKDVADSLNLFRAKYLVARGDAINISPSESLHEKYLTDTIYTPLRINNVSKVVCQDRQASFDGVNPAWIQCPLSGADGNLTEVRYLHIIVRVDVPANLDFALTDTKGSRPRWYGKTEDDYFLKANTWTEVFIPLGVSTEGGIDTDFSRIELIEVLALPLHKPLSSVGKIELKGVWYDNGQKEQINKFNMVGNFGNLRVYEPINQNFPPEFGLLTSLEETKNFEELFEKAAQKHDLLNEHGFIVTSQNQSKNLGLVTNSLEAKITDSEKVSDTKYWIKLNRQPAYLILSQNYNPEWKVLLGVDREVLNNGFFEDLKLLKKAFVSEQDHFVVNGYANLWKVDAKNTEYAIVFMPQVIADIGSKLSIFSIMLLVGFTILWHIKKYASSH